jgi:hypothetical protein
LGNKPIISEVVLSHLHSIVVPQLLQIFNQRLEISVDVIPRLLWPQYQS